MTQWLVQWSNSFLEDATWEDAFKLQQKFPLFQPLGQGFSEGVRNATIHFKLGFRDFILVILGIQE